MGVESATRLVGAARYRLNQIEVTKSRRLVRVSMYLQADTDRDIEWLIYHQNGEGDLVVARRQPATLPMGGAVWFSKKLDKPILIEAGKIYLIGAIWQGTVAYYENRAPQPLRPAEDAFGTATKAFIGNSATVPPLGLGNTASVYSMRLGTVGP